MWGTSWPDDKLTADLGNVIEAAESGDRQLIRITAGKLLPDNFRLLQHNLPIASLCNAANSVLFDYLSGAADQGGWESDSQRPGGLKIDNEFDPYGRSAGLAPLRIRPA
jgi:hypothetical protein